MKSFQWRSIVFLVGFGVFLLPCCGIDITPPKTWVMPSSIPAGIVKQYVSPSEQNGFYSNLVLTRGKLPCCREASASPDSLIAKVSRQQSRVLPLYKVLEQRKRKVAGRMGGFMVSSYAQGEKDLAFFQFFYLEGQDFVNVVYTCLLKDLSRLRPEFEKSLSMLKTDPTESAAKP